MKRIWRFATGATAGLFVLTAAFLAGRALAGGIPATGALTYSGSLQDATGAALTGSHNIQVFFWNAATSGASVCNTTSALIALDAGRFSIALPDTCATAVKASPNVWAEVLVDGASLGRTKIGAVPYAVEAGHATNADSATTANGAAGTLAKVTPWQAYTISLRYGAGGIVAGTTSAFYRRVGENVEVSISSYNSSTPAGSGLPYYFELPAGLQADTTKMAANGIVGSLLAYQGSNSTNNVGIVTVDGTNKNFLRLALHGSSQMTITSFPVASADTIAVVAQMPIAGWGLNTP